MTGCVTLSQTLTLGCLSGGTGVPSESGPLGPGMAVNGAKNFTLLGMCLVAAGPSLSKSVLPAAIGAAVGAQERRGCLCRAGDSSLCLPPLHQLCRGRVGAKESGSLAARVVPCGACLLRPPALRLWFRLSVLVCWPLAFGLPWPFSRGPPPLPPSAPPASAKHFDCKKRHHLSRPGLPAQSLPVPANPANPLPLSLAPPTSALEGLGHQKARPSSCPRTIHPGPRGWLLEVTRML